MERVLQMFENVNREHQQVRNPATMAPEATLSVIQSDPKLCSELLREEPTKEATVKMVVQYHQYRKHSSHWFEFVLFAQPLLRTNRVNNFGELFDAFWTFPLSRHIALSEVGDELIIRACRDFLVHERCLDFQDCSG